MIQDNRKAVEIMLTCDPMIIKFVGGTIPTTHMWTDNQLKVTEKGLCAKLTQNKHVSKLCSIDCGIPQGSILWPLLYLIYVNDVAQ